MVYFGLAVLGPPAELDLIESVGLQDQIIRRIEIIGEVVKNLPDNLRMDHPKVPWRDMAGMRDIVVHQYFGVDLEFVWQAATKDFPELKAKIQKIEFKESLANLDKELVAFANASGGRILVGITDGRKIKGAKISNRLKSQVQDAAGNCDPKVEIEMESFEDVLIIIVKDGEDKHEEKIRFDDLRNSQFVYGEYSAT